MRSIRMAGLALAALAALSLAGCAQKSSRDLMPGAVFAADMVKVYRGCQLADQMGSESWGDEPESYTRGNCWYFKTQASKDDMVAWYEKQFPGAEKETLDDGAVQFTLHPQGATSFEYVHVVVRDGELQVGEAYRPGREKEKPAKG